MRLLIAYINWVQVVSHQCCFSMNILSAIKLLEQYLQQMESLLEIKQRLLATSCPKSGLIQIHHPLKLSLVNAKELTSLPLSTSSMKELLHHQRIAKLSALTIQKSVLPISSQLQPRFARHLLVNMTWKEMVFKALSVPSRRRILSRPSQNSLDSVKE